MKLLIAFLSVVVVISLTGAVVAEASEKYSDVLSVVTTDFNADGGFDRAVLVAGETDATLLIYLSQRDQAGVETMPLVLTKASAAFNGMMWGQQPSLTISSKGSLEINSVQEGIGRTHWSQKITVVYRGGEFLVAGYTYSDDDTIDMKNSNCDINYLSGKAFINGKTMPIGGTVSKLADFDTTQSPAICQIK